MKKFIAILLTLSLVFSICFVSASAAAKEEAVAIIERAREEARLEKQKMADDVKKEIIAVAALMAGKVVGSNMDATIQESLIDETLKEIGDNTWLS